MHVTPAKVHSKEKDTVGPSFSPAPTKTNAKGKKKKHRKMGKTLTEIKSEEERERAKAADKKRNQKEKMNKLAAKMSKAQQVCTIRYFFIFFTQFVASSPPKPCRDKTNT